jgi:transposase
VREDQPHRQERRGASPGGDKEVQEHDDPGAVGASGLAGCFLEVELVGMEATGVYWKPLYYVLEEDLELWLLNAGHMKRTSLRQQDRRQGRRVDLPALRARPGVRPRALYHPSR